MIERHRSEHLTRNHEREKCRGADLRHKEYAKGDENGAEGPATPRPPWDARDQIRCGNRVAEREDEQNHANPAHGIAREGRPSGRMEGAPQVGVHRLLNDEADSRRDRKENGRSAVSIRGCLSGSRLAYWKRRSASRKIVQILLRRLGHAEL